MRQARKFLTARALSWLWYGDGPQSPLTRGNVTFPNCALCVVRGAPHMQKKTNTTYGSCKKNFRRLRFSIHSGVDLRVGCGQALLHPLPFGLVFPQRLLLFRCSRLVSLCLPRSGRGRIDFRLLCLREPAASAATAAVTLTIRAPLALFRHR